MFNKVVETRYTHNDEARETAAHKKQAIAALGDKVEMMSREVSEFGGPDGMIRKLRTQWRMIA